QRMLTRFDGKKVTGWAFVGLLKKPEWKAGEYSNDGRVKAVSRVLPEFSLRLVIRFTPGLYGEFGFDAEDQTIEGVFFVPGVQEQGRLDAGSAVPLGSVDLMVLSEVVGMLSGWG